MSQSPYATESGPTCTSALADAADSAGFTFVATWYDTPNYKDFFIERIANDQNSATHSWQILLNDAPILVGGCQQKVTEGQRVLFAFRPNPPPPQPTECLLLNLTAPVQTAQVGVPYHVKVTDDATGAAIEGASVGGVSTDKDGAAEITFTCSGAKELTATAPNYLQSNVIEVTVSP